MAAIAAGVEGLELVAPVDVLCASEVALTQRVTSATTTRSSSKAATTCIAGYPRELFTQKIKKENNTNKYQSGCTDFKIDPARRVRTCRARVPISVPTSPA